MQTEARFLVGDARDLQAVGDESVDLVVTSPPYPLIEMWDEAFGAMTAAAVEALARSDGPAAFEAMHGELDRAWAACARVLRPGGIACINVGDATRTLGGRFQLYPNHARVLAGAARAGLTVLPDILWRKPTNAPTKFLGSGMLPAGAYVTYEHEYILVLRKGDKRTFRSGDEQANRRRSAYFWEERNVWFSDLWSGLVGAQQDLPKSAARERSAAFPLEVARRLVLMYSVYGDVVLDPFAGTGTTLCAAMACGRSAIGVDREPSLSDACAEQLERAPGIGRAYAAARLEAHRAFTDERVAAGKPPKHRNAPHDVPVVTAQEKDLELLAPVSIRRVGPGRWRAEQARVPRGTPAAGSTLFPLR